jgi:hypothetical protein
MKLPDAPLWLLNLLKGTALDPSASSATPPTKQQLEDILASLPTDCTEACPCRQQLMRVHLREAPSWDAAQPGYSTVHTDLVQVLPELGAVLLDKQHSLGALNAALSFYNW